MRRGLLVLLAFVAFLSTPAAALAVGPGAISGTVSPAAIAPEVEVCVVEPRPSELCTAPDASGAYRLTGVPVGPLRVEFLPSHRSGYLVQYYDHKPLLREATVLVMPSPPGSELEGINAELEPGSEIEGTVTAAPGGDPLGGVEVCVQEAGTGVSVGCAESAESGKYAVTGMASGVYKVGFWGRGRAADYAPQFFGGTEAFNSAIAIAVPPAGNVTGIDAELAKGARVEGMVASASDGSALPRIPVCLFGVAAVKPSQCAFTEPTGAYAMVGIPTGEYQVGFSPDPAELGGAAILIGGDGYLPQYYFRAANRWESQTLSLSSGQVLAGIDARLSAVASMPPILPPASSPTAPAAAVQFVGEPIRQPRHKKSCSGSRQKGGAKGKAKCVKNRGRRTRRHRRRRR